MAVLTWGNNLIETFGGTLNTEFSCKSELGLSGMLVLRLGIWVRAGCFTVNPFDLYLVIYIYHRQPVSPDNGRQL